jgi:hypothetical protein
MCEHPPSKYRAAKRPRLLHEFRVKLLIPRTHSGFESHELEELKVVIVDLPAGDRQSQHNTTLFI